MDENNKKFWHISWHRWPERSSIQSIYEIVFLLIVFAVCLYVYSEWNKVKMVKFDSRIACLDRSISLDSIGKDSVKHSVKRNITKATAQFDIVVPMTMLEHKHYLVNDSFIKKYYNFSIVTSVDTSKVFNDYPSTNKIFANGVWLNKQYETPDFLKNCYERQFKGSHDENNVFPFFCSKSTFFYRDNYSRNPFKKLFKVEVNKDSEKEKAEFMGLSFLTGEDGEEARKSVSYEDSVIFVDYFHVSLTRIAGRVLSVETPIWFLPVKPKPFALGNPGWLSLEDISQQYYNIRIGLYDIDSLSLKIDFCGATEFSLMNPEPDQKGMSYILFTDPQKINEIMLAGLTFHAKFKEMENMQQIRLFFLTSVMAGIVTILIVFIIIGLYKITKNYNKSKSVAAFLLFFGGGIFVYTITYWFVMYRIVKGGVFVCNLVTIPITLFILWLLYQSYKLLKKDFRSLLFRMCVVFFIVTLGYAYSITFDPHKMLEYGKYNRALSLMYDKVMSEDSVSQEDLMMLRESLVGKVDSMCNVKYVEKNDRLGLLLVTQGDSVILYDTKKKQNHLFLMPNTYGARFLNDSLIYAIKEGKESPDSTSLLWIDGSNRTAMLEGLFVAGDGLVIATTGKCSNDSTSLNIYNLRENNAKVFKLLFPYAIKSDDFKLNDEKLLLITRQDTLKNYALYDLRLLKKYWEGTLKGKIEFFLGDYLITSDWDKKCSYIYDIRKQLQLKRIIKGVEPGIIDENNKVFKTGFGENKYFYTLKPDSICVDSFLHGDRIHVNKEWTSRVIDILKKARNKNLFYKTQDSVNIYFYDSFQKKLLSYDKRQGGTPQQFPVNIEPGIHVYNGKAIFFNYRNDTMIVYNENLGIAKRINAKLLRSDYFIGSVDDRIVVYHVNDLSNPIIVNHGLGFMRFWGGIDERFNIINGWMYNLKEHKLYVENVESWNVMISNHKYLSDKEKKRLKEKLKVHNIH